MGYQFTYTQTSGKGEISKQRQLNKKLWYNAIQDLGFYKMRWILKFLLK